MKIESKIGKSEYKAEIIYNFITDFRNFKNIIPQNKVRDWEADYDSCSFRMDPIGRMGMKVTEKEPFNLVKISSDKALSAYNFTMWIQIKEIQASDTRVKITIEPDINKMILPMVKTPLKQFVDSLIDQIEAYNFGDIK